MSTFWPESEHILREEQKLPCYTSHTLHTFQATQFWGYSSIYYYLSLNIAVFLLYTLPETFFLPSRRCTAPNIQFHKYDYVPSALAERLVCVYIIVGWAKNPLAHKLEKYGRILPSNARKDYQLHFPYQIYYLSGKTHLPPHMFRY